MLLQDIRLRPLFSINFESQTYERINSQAMIGTSVNILGKLKIVPQIIFKGP